MLRVSAARQIITNFILTSAIILNYSVFITHCDMSIRNTILEIITSIYDVF